MAEGDDPATAAAVAEARLRAGDPSALGDLFALHRDRLARIVAFRMDRRLAARLDVEDVLQEAFVAAAARLRHFLARPDGVAFVWLRLIANQTLTDLHRQHVEAECRAAGRDVSLAPPTGATTRACLAAGLADHGASPSGAAQGKELAAQLEAALAGLPELDQEIIAMRHFEELSNAEAAFALGIAATAASNRYVRALGRLRQALAEVPGFAWG